jgi:hypothetical protein
MFVGNAHVSRWSFKGLLFAIRIRRPPVPSRRQLSRLYHVAQPVKVAQGGTIQEVRDLLINPVGGVNRPAEFEIIG